ncbi:MAG: DUF2993 domain-containing protein [Cyanobacteria bacterium P01_A01_bin.40]
MISKLLSAAVKLYLRSQVNQVEALQVKIVGKNKQILKGYIPQVFLSCDRAIYQGLYLSQIELKGTDIAVNLPEVVKKKPLRLLEPVFVEIQLKLDEADLQASLNSELLQSGLDDLWQMILTAQNQFSASELSKLAIEWHSIAIADQNLNLVGTYQNSAEETQEICLSTRLSLANHHTLCLSEVRISNQSSLASEFQDQLKIDLGTDVAIAKLIIEAEQIVCAGKIRINN